MLPFLNGAASSNGSAMESAKIAASQMLPVIYTNVLSPAKMPGACQTKGGYASLAIATWLYYATHVTVKLIAKRIHGKSGGPFDASNTAKRQCVNGTQVFSGKHQKGDSVPMNEKNKLKQQILRLEGDLLDLDSRMMRMLNRLEYLEKKLDEWERKESYTYSVGEIGTYPHQDTTWIDYKP